MTTFNGKIFFYCVPSGSPENTPYQHMIICLAEGLRALGIEFYSDINHWQISPEKEEYLFQHNPEVTPEDCAVVVLNHEWLSVAKRPLPKNLFNKNRNYITVYMDADDGSTTPSLQPEFRQFDYIFKSHHNNKFKYPSNIYPWAFGLSERILKELRSLPNFQDRNRQLLVNFRATQKYNHSLRQTIYKEFLPQIQKALPVNIKIDNLSGEEQPDPYHYLQWRQTGGRHNPYYYNSLKNSLACACFGGFFVTPWPADHASIISRFLKRILSKTGLKSNRIIQWDSWRLWESLAAGCTSFHVDFEKYGCLLPVMPKNWQHYIGVDLDNIQEVVDRIIEEPDILERISIEGKMWVLEHYSPIPTAQRFLETVSHKIDEDNERKYEKTYHPCS